MTMEFSLCKNCGDVFHPDEVEGGYCYNCAPDAGAILSLEEPPKVDWNSLGDCE